MKKTKEAISLLEIGVEEIPARFIPPALKQLDTLVSEGLKEAGLSFKKIEVLGTPRRLAVLIYGLPIKADDRVEVAVGPPPKAAKDSEGNWTKAALGFAKAQKVAVEKLIVKNTSKGERYVAENAIKGQKTETVLKDLFPSLVQKLNFPKSMVWQADRFRFARPIRWFVALFNSKVIRFRLAGVQSDRNTVGLLSLGGKKIPISKPEKYESLLQSRCIIVDPAVRRKKISQQLESLAKKMKAKPVLDAEHLEEVVNINEYPNSILGHFPESYLALPKEVLVSVLRKHQKFFPLENAKKQLINAFVGVRNGPSEAQEGVRDGYERVLLARLADAKFFFDKDVTIPLERFSSRLNEVGFIQEVGTLKEKVARVQTIIEKIHNSIGLSADIKTKATRVALLSKADLLTQMVGEFPELQGVAGRFYAVFQKEDSDIAHAIEHHYWPLSADGALPPTSIGAIVSLADKLDTVAAHFSVGHAPSGSADPYALRRLSIGILRICLDRGWPLSLDSLVDTAYAFQDEAKKTELKEFFRQRCFHWFGNQGYRSDEIEAVLSTTGQSLIDIAEKLRSLKAIRGKPEFASLAIAIKRARNILKQAQGKGVLPPPEFLLNQAELQNDVEKSLLTAIEQTRPKLNEAIKKRQFDSALLQLAPLKGPVDAFFEGVMVMVEDEKARSQRLALLRSIEGLFGSLADFSKIQDTPTSTKN